MHSRYNDGVRRLWNEGLDFVAATFVVPEVTVAVACRDGRLACADAVVAQRCEA